jgi:hypothetical protein
MSMTTAIVAQPTTRLALRIGRSKMLRACSSLDEASRLYVAATVVHVSAGGHGASDFPEGKVYDTTAAKPKLVARVSWNGKVWPVKPWSPGDVPMFDPAAVAP